MKNTIVVILMCFAVSVSAEVDTYDLEDHKRVANKFDFMLFIKPNFHKQLLDKIKGDANVKCHEKLGRAYDACYNEISYGILREYEPDIDYYITEANKAYE